MADERKVRLQTRSVRDSVGRSGKSENQRELSQTASGFLTVLAFKLFRVWVVHYG